MSLKYVRDSLPWLVPSAAIVFAASGFLESQKDEAAEVAAVAPAAVVAPQPAAPATFSATVPAATDAPALVAEDEEMVARQASSDTGLGPITGATALTQPVAAAPTPAPTPVATPAPERQAALAAANSATPVFNSNSFAAQNQQQCIDDLRNMADQARVYFPSGGLTADEGGIEQGRLIGLIAQTCPGVQIRVEGHSDPSGDPAANLRLSEARAQQVIKRIGASGIDTSMFFAEGLGDRQPSGIAGPRPSSYYDRRVQFSIVDGSVTRVAVRTPASVQPWANASCVTELQRAVDATALFYAPRSVSLRSGDLGGDGPGHTCHGMPARAPARDRPPCR